MVADNDRCIDAGDLAVREMRRATEFLDVEAEQPVAVIEKAVAVGVPVDRRVRHAIALVAGHGIVEHIGAG